MPDGYVEEIAPIDSGYTLADRESNPKDTRWNRKSSSAQSSPSDSSVERHSTTSGTDADAPISKSMRIKGRKTAPLWKEVQEPGGEKYYINTKSGETSWERPLDFVDAGREYTGLSIDTSLPLDTLLSLIHIEDAVGEGALVSNLETLLKIVQEAGSEEEWRYRLAHLYILCV